MAQTAKWIFTTNQSVTITLASLANKTIAVSSFIDNRTNGYLCMDLQIEVKTASVVAGGIYVGAGVGVYLVRTLDNNTAGQFDRAIGAGTANTDPINLDNAELLTVIFTPSSTTTYIGSARIEALPPIFKFFVYNGAGGTLDSTAGNFYMKYVGKKLQLV